MTNSKLPLSSGGFSLGDHPGDEILVPDPAVGPHLDLPDPLVELGGLELLADAGEDVAQIGDGDVAGGLLVEDLEGVAELAVEGLRPEVPGHEVEEAREVEGGGEALAGDDGLELGLGRVPAEGAHEDPQLRRRDPAVAVGVEEGERLLHGGDLVVGQVLAHFLLSGLRLRVRVLPLLGSGGGGRKEVT